MDFKNYFEAFVRKSGITPASLMQTRRSKKFWTFIYNRNGILDYEDGNYYHSDIKKKKGYYDRGLGAETHPDILEGRVGTLNGKEYVAVWDVDSDLVNPCLKKLLSQNLIDGSELFANTNKTVNEYLGGTHTSDADYNDLLKKQKELHLLPPDQKKTAMSQLGLSQGSRVSNMQRIVSPGHKLWAPTSENNERP